MRLEEDWRKLAALGPRFMGTGGAEKAVRVLQDLFDSRWITERQQFAYSGWHINSEPELELISPVRERVEAQTFVWGGPTPPEGVKGRLGYLGQYNVWGMYDWEKFGIINASGEIVGYVLCRNNGPAIPQVQSPGTSCLPHFILGSEETRRIMGWLARGVNVEVFGRIDSVSTGPSTGESLVSRLPSENAERELILICAHYDTLFNTSGAYDNASGVACALELARRLAEKPALVGVRVALLGGEEWRLAGAKALVEYYRQERELDRLACVINLDGMGRGSILEIWSGPEEFEARIWTWLRSQQVPGRVVTVFRFPPPPGGDHAVFYDEGIPVVMLTFNDQAILHRAEDTCDERMLENMQFSVELVEAMVRDFMSLRVAR